MSTHENAPAPEMLVMMAEAYEPTMNADGIFVDRIPNIPSHGITCNCSVRKTTFYSRQSFITHVKTKTHISWVSQYNNKRGTILTDNDELRETVRQQKIIITELSQQLSAIKQTISLKDIQIQALSEKISTLTHQLIENSIHVD